MPRAPLINQFKKYADRVIGSFRFGQDQKTRDFIESVLAAAERSRHQAEPGRKFWRAQLGHHNVVSVRDANGEWSYDSIRPHTRERMTPSSRFVKNGRANPVGIAYWYGATDPKTAVAEMRPWKGAVLTVAELKAKRNLQFVDHGNTCAMVAPYDSAEEAWQRCVWNLIGEAFSRPVAPYGQQNVCVTILSLAVTRCGNVSSSAHRELERLVSNPDCRGALWSTRPCGRRTVERLRGLELTRYARVQTFSGMFRSSA